MSNSISPATSSLSRGEGARPGIWASLLLSTPAVVIYLGPALGEWLAYDRAAIAAGQLWRLITGHWTHWSADQLGWDLLIFALLGIFWERTGQRRLFLVCAVGSALIISLTVWFFLPEIGFYRGLSGIDCALVTAVAVQSLQRSVKSGQRGLSLALTAVLVGYFLKILYEFTTGSTLFVSSENSTFTALPLTHLVGGIIGLGVAFTGNECHRATPEPASATPE
ncbi:MAG: rhombosortase [bacterium]|nr:rhombosortase [bacterium]